MRAAVALVLGAAVPTSAAAAASSGSMVELAGPSAPPAGAAALGPAPAGQEMSATVYLAQPRSAEAAAYAQAVSDPRDPLYRHFLSPAQYRSRFAPSDATAAAVAGFLSGEGLTVTAGPANHLYVRASGTVADIDRAFHTTIETFRHQGGLITAPSAPVSVPAAVAPLIAGVSGLDSGAGGVVRQAPPPAAASASCSSYTFQNTATLPPAYGRTQFPTHDCGYTPAQVHSAYQTTDLLAHGIDGRGVNVAVLLFYPIPTVVSDIDRFSAAHGLPALAPGQLSEVLPASFVEPPPAGCPLASDQNEAEGDLETVHDMAPGAHEVYVAAASCAPQDILAATNEIVDRHLADIVTNSYTLAFSTVPQAVVDAAHQAFVQAAAEGIGLYYGSGDLGDLSTFTGTAQTTWPESDPFVTSVGGTSLFIGPSGAREGEVGWGMTLDPVAAPGTAYQQAVPGTFFIGSGGGRTQYPQPSYQRGVVPADLAGPASPVRVVPDIAADADLATGILVGLTVDGTYQEGPGGGTSVASPLWAGLEALADQAAGRPHGFINPLLYLLHGTGAFHDIVDTPVPLALEFDLNGTTNLDTLQADTSLSATPGYDDQTGLGSPDGARYVAALAHLTRGSAP